MGFLPPVIALAVACSRKTIAAKPANAAVLACCPVISTLITASGEDRRLVSPTISGVAEGGTADFVRRGLRCRFPPGQIFVVPQEDATGRYVQAGTTRNAARGPSPQPCAGMLPVVPLRVPTEFITSKGKRPAERRDPRSLHTLRAPRSGDCTAAVWVNMRDRPRPACTGVATSLLSELYGHTSTSATTRPLPYSQPACREQRSGAALPGNAPEGGEQLPCRDAEAESGASHAARSPRRSPPRGCDARTGRLGPRPRPPLPLPPAPGAGARQPRA
eukprot:scaffold653_cov379-Prasinococcus_capsulatus_cf.AAC.1